MLILLLRLLRVAAASYLGLVACVYMYQDHLLFKPQPLTEAAASEISLQHPNAEPVTFRAQDGIALHGWWVHDHLTSNQPLIIYFGGNAEEVSWMIERQQRLGGWSLLLINYRGYGRSDGEPGEHELFADALRIYDHITAQPHIDRQRIVVMGRSLGTGVAVYLASQRPTAGVVLITPYDSMLAVAQEHYPYLPVALMLRHRFDSISYAARIYAPLLVLAATDDLVVPYSHAQRLQHAWAGISQWRLLPDADHLSISKSPVFWQHIREFLSTLH